MTSRPARGGTSQWLAVEVEALATRLAYGAGLGCAGPACAWWAASGRVIYALPTGAACRIYGPTTLGSSRSSSSRSASAPASTCGCAERPRRRRRGASRGAARLFLEAASRTVALLATGLARLPLGQCGHASRDARGSCDAPGQLARGGNLAGDSTTAVRQLRPRAPLSEGPRDGVSQFGLAT